MTDEVAEPAKDLDAMEDETENQDDDGERFATKRRRPLLFSLAIGLALVLLSTGCAAFAGYRYEKARSGLLLPGVFVSGIDIGGMTRAEAERVLAPRLSSVLDRKLRIRAGGVKWVRTARQLGVRASVDRALDRAIGMSNRLGWTSRLFHRLLDRPVGEEFDMAVSLKDSAVEGFVNNAAERVFKRPTNAFLDVQDGQVVKRGSAPGRELLTGPARKAILRALEGGRSSVKLRFREIAPAVTEANLGDTIIVRLSENRLYLYDGLKLARTYRVATGSPEFPTPQGRFSVINKRINPTWVNPAKDTWGKDLPDRIPPGPDNPLGTRSLDLSAPGIRIHGTPSSGSIGQYASHGCIRMFISDSEALFPLIEIGTPVIIAW
ncbi:MAG TPA: L,D-transpeptidase family protein [Actinomycetota bacterium]|nr:L,D-transpeptidase family protein [Actinomycetota bacterium]